MSKYRSVDAAWRCFLAVMTLASASPLILSGCCLAAAQPPGAASPIPRYGKFETAFTLADQTGNPFDPQDNDVDALVSGPSNLHQEVPAFWDGDRWRVRYAPAYLGVYSLKIERNGKPEHPEGLTAARFRCVPSDDPGYVRVSKTEPQRFQFDSGQGYYPLGIDAAWHNNNPAEPDYPGLFAHFGQSHLNWARVWTTYWDGKALDWSNYKPNNARPGYLLLDAARRWDMVMDSAAKNGVYVQMVLQHHGQYTRTTDSNWADNPLNTANGGFLADPQDFFTDPRAKRLTKAKYRYTVARWGYSTHLLSFELFNEVQNITEVKDNFQPVVDWHKEMAAYIRSIDTNHHLITTSNSPPGDPLSKIGLDYTQIHSYPPDIVSTFANVRAVPNSAPAFYGEWGASVNGSLEAEQAAHNGLWAGMMVPLAGAGQYWYWDRVSDHDWWPDFAAAGGYAKAFSIARFGGMTALHPRVSSPGAAADLSFAPAGGWAPTTVYDVTLPTDGSAPNLIGVSQFIQGSYNRPLMTRPIAFHLDPQASCSFQVTLDTVAKSGATPVLRLDGQSAQQFAFPAQAADHPANLTLNVTVPAGSHTVSLFNTGADWVSVKQITVTNYAPSVGALARGNGRVALFWAYARSAAASGRSDAAITLNNWTPGSYRIYFWDTSRGTPAGSVAAHVGADGCLKFPLRGLASDLAGVAAPASGAAARS